METREELLEEMKQAKEGGHRYMVKALKAKLSHLPREVKVVKKVDNVSKKIVKTLKSSKKSFFKKKK